MRKPALHTAALLAATTLGLTACLPTPSSSAPEPEPPELPDIEIDDADGVDVEEPAGGDGETIDIVGSFEYDDGLVVELSNFYRGTSSGTGIPDNEEFIAWTLHLENNTGGDIDAHLAGVDCTIGEFGQDTEQVIDAEQDLLNDITGTLHDGESASGDYACAMMSNEDYLEVEVQVRDVGTRDSVYFSGYVD